MSRSRATGLSERIITTGRPHKCQRRASAAAHATMDCIHHPRNEGSGAYAKIRELQAWAEAQQ
jgi:hypothetical protein